MVQIQINWFPVIDINSQTFVNIHANDEKDFKQAYYTVNFSNEFPPYIQLNAFDGLIE